MLFPFFIHLFPIIVNLIYLFDLNIYCFIIKILFYNILLLIKILGDTMRVKKFIGSVVLDKNANEVGKVADVDFNKETGAIENVILTLQKNIFSSDELEIAFEDIATIGAYVILNKEIPKEVEEDEAKTVEVEDE